MKRKKTKRPTAYNILDRLLDTFMFTKNEDRSKTLRNGISSSELTGKRVLLRLDLNLPMGKNKIIDSSEEWRIIAALPTIKYLIAQNAKVIILTHLGRPRGKIAENLRLGNIQDKLSELLDVSVSRMPDCIGEEVEKAVEKMEAGEILLLENLRFHRGEEENDNNFSKNLARLGDIYINDAFADCHRNHSSIVGITKFLPSYAGLLLEKEIQTMEKFYNPKHPAVAIIGGAKLETKLPAAQALSKIYDYVLVGGMIANEIIKNPRRYIVSSNVILPDEEGILKEKGYDIGLISVKKFANFIKNAKSIIWNGPMGKFENPKYQTGTKGLIDLIKIARKNGAMILIGGGETIAAAQRFAPEFFEYKERMHISTGGGAMLEFLAGKKLQGIEALKK